MSLDSGLHTHTQEKVAIKIINMADINNEVTHYLLNCEKEALLTINHPHVLKAFNIYQEKHSCNIITPYCEGGNLKEYILKKSTKHFIKNLCRKNKPSSYSTNYWKGIKVSRTIISSIGIWNPQTSCSRTRNPSLLTLATVRKPTGKNLKFSIMLAHPRICRLKLFIKLPIQKRVISGPWELFFFRCFRGILSTGVSLSIGISVP